MDNEELQRRRQLAGLAPHFVEVVPGGGPTLEEVARQVGQGSGIGGSTGDTAGAGARHQHGSKRKGGKRK